MSWTGIIGDTLRAMFGETAIVFALAAIGLNIHFGYTGLLNFGQAVFMAAGAYGLALFVAEVGDWGNLPFWAGVLIGLFGIPVLLAIVLGIPTLRLRADYLAIVTIATAEIFRLLARSPQFDSVTGSSDGLTQFAQPFYEPSPFNPRERYLPIPGITNSTSAGTVDADGNVLAGVSDSGGLFTGNQMWLVIIGWAVVAMVVFAVWLLMRSPWGRVLRAIREDEDAARSLGKNAYSYKMQALIVGGVIGAMGGMLRSIGTQLANPDQFITDVTFFAWVAVILGGVAKVFGPVLGSMVFWGILGFADSFLRNAVERTVSGEQLGFIPDSILTTTQVGQVRFILVGLLLALLAAFRPQGILGNKEEMALDDR